MTSVIITFSSLHADVHSQYGSNLNHKLSPTSHYPVTHIISVVKSTDTHTETMVRKRENKAIRQSELSKQIIKPRENAMHLITTKYRGVCMCMWLNGVSGQNGAHAIEKTVELYMQLILLPCTFLIYKQNQSQQHTSQNEEVNQWRSDSTVYLMLNWPV